MPDVTWVVDRIKKASSPAVTVEDSVYLDFVNEAQRQICRLGRFWFQRASTDINTVADTQDIDLPAELLEVIAVGRFVQGSPGDYTTLDPIDVKSARNLFSSDDRGSPQFYSVNVQSATTGLEQWDLWPIPDAVYTVRIDYWRYLPDLATGGSNILTLRYPMILVHKATMIALSDLMEDEFLAMQTQLFENEMARLRSENVRRELGPQPSVGIWDTAGSTQGQRYFGGYPFWNRP